MKKLDRVGINDANCLNIIMPIPKQTYRIGNIYSIRIRVNKENKSQISYKGH